MIKFGQLIKRSGSSRHRGVSWDKSRQKWRAQVSFGYNIYYAGIWNTEEMAVDAYFKMREKLEYKVNN